VAVSGLQHVTRSENGKKKAIRPVLSLSIMLVKLFGGVHAEVKWVISDLITSKCEV
jgi:hypothetical protein